MFNKNQKRGLKFGIASPFFYAIDSVLDILLFAIIFGAGFRSKMGLSETVVYAFITSLVKDFMLFLALEIKTKGRVLEILLKLYREKPKAFWWTVLGSLFGGPLGFSLTTATILYTGAAYGSAMANFSPIIVMVFANKFFKTKLHWQGWLGVFLAVAGFTSLAFYSSFINGNSFEFNLRIFIGVILAILAVMTWSIETIVAEYTEKLGITKSLTDDEKLSIKSTFSSLSLIIIFIPISLIITYSIGDGSDVSNVLVKIFTNWQWYLILFSIGLIIVIGRFFYWFAISGLGGGRADILYYLTVLITPLIVILLNALNITGFYRPKGALDWIYWMLIFVQISGVFLVTWFAKNNKKHLFEKK